MAFSGPTPPYNNVPIQPDNYQPRVFVISNIILGSTTTVITTLPMNYVIGQQVRLNIPRLNGANQLNGTTSYVIEIPDPNTVILDLNSTQFDFFIQGDFPNVPQITAIGDINSGNLNGKFSLTNLTVLGAFINIS